MKQCKLAHALSLADRKTDIHTKMDLKNKTENQDIHQETRTNHQETRTILKLSFKKPVEKTNYMKHTTTYDRRFALERQAG